MQGNNIGPIAPRLERLDGEQDREGAGGITPLESNALGLRDAMLRPDRPSRMSALGRRRRKRS